MLYLQAKWSLYKQVPQKSKKLVAVMATSTSMTEKTEEELECVLCIWYPVTFKDKTKTLLDLGSKVNIMSQVFSHQLGLKIHKTDVDTQKIDGTTLKIYKMVVSIFFMSNKDGREKFFEESFLLANIKLDIVLKCPY